MPKKNLSETLFKPRTDCPETSALIRRISSSGTQSADRWYRLIDRLAWIWRGISPWEIIEVQSRMAASNAPRSNERLYDTVIGYRNGNWVYEWCQQAMLWQQRASQAVQNTDRAHCGYKASTLYSIAAYPYLQGDELAGQALLLAKRAYEQALLYLNYTVKTLEFTLEYGKPVSGFLYLPESVPPPCPAVIMCGELDALQSDYQRFFEDYLAPRGLAMLSIDMPAVGSSARYKLSQDSSQLHQRMIQSLDSIPWVDARRIAAFGFRFGANVAVRLAYLQAPQLKAVACLSPVVHQLFTNPLLQQRLPGMCLDVLASRLGMNNTTNSHLYSALNTYSLKTQGLLGHNCPTPMLACFWQNDPFSPQEDARLIASSSAAGTLLEMHFNPVYRNFDHTLNVISDWLRENLYS